MSKRTTNKFIPKLSKVAVSMGEPLVLPNHSGIATHPEARRTFVQIAGDTMTGNLNMVGNQTTYDTTNKVYAIGNELFLDGENKVIANINGVSELKISTDQLEFQNGPNRVAFKWPTSNELELHFGTLKYTFKDTGLLLDTSNAIYLRSTDNYIKSSAAGSLTINADTQFKNSIGGQVKWSISSSTVNFLVDVDVDEDLNVDKEAKGFFATYIGHGSSISADSYLTLPSGAVMSSTRGWTAIHGGSIVGIGVSATVVGAFLASWNIYARVNGSNKLSVNMTTSTSGDKNIRASAARNTHTFSQGDVISIYADEVGGLSSITDIDVHVRVQYNT